MMMLLVLSDETVDLFDTQQMIHSRRTNILTEYRQTRICETSPAVPSVMDSPAPACAGTANQEPRFYVHI